MVTLLLFAAPNMSSGRIHIFNKFQYLFPSFFHTAESLTVLQNCLLNSVKLSFPPTLGEPISYRHNEASEYEYSDAQCGEDTYCKCCDVWMGLYKGQEVPSITNHVPEVGVDPGRSPYLVHEKNSPIKGQNEQNAEIELPEDVVQYQADDDQSNSHNFISNCL